MPRDERDIWIAIDIARDLKVPVLPRGAGTSQCGQTVGAALVIDNSKHLRRVLDIDVARRTALVQPGLVLDELNAQLKPHGLWFPVDVSTSAQATLGGMAGNNSCGSRSIAYGNMVHNVLGMSAWLSDGAWSSSDPFRRSPAAPRRSRRSCASSRRGIAMTSRSAGRRSCAAWAATTWISSTIRANVPIPATATSISLICWSAPRERSPTPKTLTLQLSALPRHRVLGVVNFPTFRAAMQAAQHLVKLGPSAVELVDRIMIELSLANAEFPAPARTGADRTPGRDSAGRIQRR